MKNNKHSINMSTPAVSGMMIIRRTREPITLWEKIQAFFGKKFINPIFMEATQYFRMRRRHAKR